METNPILARYALVEPDCKAADAPLQVRRDGDRLCIQTCAQTVERARLLTRLTGLGIFIAGLTLLVVTRWGGVVAAAGVLAFLLVPGRLRIATLLEIDAASGKALATRRDAGTDAAVPIDRIAEVRGSYQTQGWDGSSVLYAALTDGSQIPLLVINGTDERLAEYACRLLGLLLDRPATYAGPFGGVKACYTPDFHSASPA